MSVRLELVRVLDVTIVVAVVAPPLISTSVERERPGSVVESFVTTVAIVHDGLSAITLVDATSADDDKVRRQGVTPLTLLAVTIEHDGCVRSVALGCLSCWMEMVCSC